MKELIKHLWKNNRYEILSRSLLNCHIVGLHSIMLSESPNKTIRMYVAEPNNKLDYPKDDYNFPLAVHPHHCNLTLHVMLGEVHNLLYRVVKNFGKIPSWKYTSKITTGDIKFELIDEYNSLLLDNTIILKEGDSIHMLGEQLHTVVTPNKDEYTAWMVYEGQEDINYDNICYTTLNPNDAVEGLYIAPTEDKVKFLLEKIFNINNL